MAKQEITVEGIKSAIIASLKADEVEDSLWELRPDERTSEEIHALAFINAGTVFIMGNLFKSYPKATRQLYREAVVETVSDWNRKEYDADFLREATTLVAYTRSMRAMWLLMDHVEKDLIKYQDPASQDALSQSVRVIAGFAPNEEVRQILQPWMFDPRFERQIGVLMNGLSQCTPSAYPVYLGRWMQVAEDYPDYVKPRGTIFELVRVVGWPTIKSELGRVPQKYRGKFEGLLSEVRSLDIIKE